MKKIEKYIPYVLFIATVIGWVVSGMVNSRIIKMEVDTLKSTTYKNEINITKIKENLVVFSNVNSVLSESNNAINNNTDLIFKLNEQLKKQNMLNGQIIMYIKLNSTIDIE